MDGGATLSEQNTNRFNKINTYKRDKTNIKNKEDNLKLITGIKEKQNDLKRVNQQNESI